MKTRLVRTNEYGLAVLPTELDCFGGKCTSKRKATSKGCYVDDHHLYFTRQKFEQGGPESTLYQFRNDPFNIVSMPRCRHNQIHDKHTGAYIPPLVVMEAFLEQSTILRSLGVGAVSLARLELDLEGENFRRLATIASRDVELFYENRDSQREQVAQLAAQARDLDLLPSQARSNPLDYVGKRLPVQTAWMAQQILAAVA